MANTFTWTEIPASDLDAATDFYAAVFGWRFAPFGPDYRLATLADGTQVCGVYRWTEPNGDGVRPYVSVTDLEATLAAVAGAGGSVVHTRELVGEDMGWWADFRDPNGVLIGLTTGQPAAG